MKIRDLGPFAVFRTGGRVYVKSAGMIQRLDRSGRYFDGYESLADWLEKDVDQVELLAPLPGSDCTTCYGSGYEPGKYDAQMHGVRARCPNGCPIEGYVEPEITKEEEPARCECCKQPLLDCERDGATAAATTPAALATI